jgi:hypothetical protein
MYLASGADRDAHPESTTIDRRATISQTALARHRQPGFTCRPFQSSTRASPADFIRRMELAPTAGSEDSVILMIGLQTRPRYSVILSDLRKEPSL